MCLHRLGEDWMNRADEFVSDITALLIDQDPNNHSAIYAIFLRFFGITNICNNLVDIDGNRFAFSEAIGFCPFSLIAFGP